jgi:hypothetical protein
VGDLGPLAPQWSTGIYYHERLEYEAASKQLTLSVFDRLSGTPLWHLSGPVPSFPADMTRIAVHRSGVVGNPGVSPSATVAYELDNVVLCQVQPSGNCDSDRDGVPDAADQCPNTPAGEVVNAVGCSISQLVPASWPWKNHGEYVSTVARVAGESLAQGLITGAQRGAIVSAAARSDVWKRR